ncbi:transmembrane protein 127-like [Clavelina lepadiformis]|uniref:transmembrane protein 127-like n=1 Tax=Clavelina lepadiformis TaxID=159417 RepID=UPI004042291F
MSLFRRNGSSSDERSSRYAYSPQYRKFKEKNILSAMLGTATIVVLCASLVEPVWFQLEGGKCGKPYLGVNTFFDTFTSGSFTIDISEGHNQFEYCVNSKTVTLVQVIIIFCILAICFSLFSFVLDIIAPRTKPLWKMLKRYSLGYIFTALLCATIVGFSYWASQEIYDLQYNNRKYEGSKVLVSFATGVYLVTAAGGIAILATASNLMRQYPTDEEEQAERLMDEQSDDESESPWGNLAAAGGPPPYVP